MDRGRVLAVDYGAKRVGLASGDLGSRIAFPKGFIENKSSSFLIKELLDFCLDWGITKIVFGLPINMSSNDSENPIMAKMKDFVSKLEESIFNSSKDNIQLIDIVFFDERLSTFEAESLIDKNSDFFKDKMMHKDAIAAKVILERYFESLTKDLDVN